MCNRACIEFGRSQLRPDEVAGRDVLEVGSLDVNGSLRSVVEAMGPGRYVGVDLAPGPGVDQICDAGDLMRRFGRASFDVVLCTEVVEHVRDWRGVVANLKGVLKTGGILILTTRSCGFKYHGYPYDFWRYEIGDLQVIFSDLTVLALERDPLAPGVFVKARRPESFVEKDLSNHALHSVLTARRMREIRRRDVVALTVRHRLRRIAPRALRAAVARRRA
jgi:SAM-dependent methyltransferase